MPTVKPWWFVFGEFDALTKVGVTAATPVRFDPLTSKIEILDTNDDCSEWVVREADVANCNWIEKLNSSFGIQPVYMDASTIVEFNTEFVSISHEGQRLLFTAEMAEEYGQLMNSVW